MWLYGHENGKETHFDNIQKSGFYGWIKLCPYAAILIARMGEGRNNLQRTEQRKDERG